MSESIGAYFQYIDPEKTGLYVAKLNANISEDGMEAMRKQFDKTFTEQCPGSKVLILPPIFESMTIFDETAMNENGWFKKEELPPSDTPSDEMSVLTKR